MLAELVFNMGWGKVAEFGRMLGDLEAARDATAAADLLESGWAHQVGSRAPRLAAELRTGIRSRKRRRWRPARRPTMR